MQYGTNFSNPKLWRNSVNLQSQQTNGFVFYPSEWNFVSIDFIPGFAETDIENKKNWKRNRYKKPEPSNTSLREDFSNFMCVFVELLNHISHIFNFIGKLVDFWNKQNFVKIRAYLKKSLSRLASPDCEKQIN